MHTRRQFLQRSGTLAAGTFLLPNLGWSVIKEQKFGVQLYSFRDQMVRDAEGTLRKIAALGFKEIESARSKNGHYYGLSPKEMKSVCQDLGMQLVSGHVHLDNNFEKTLEQAVASGQPYLICSSLPSKGQTVDNYKKVAEAFNSAGETCRKMGVKFGYHNHEYEFEADRGQVLYDVLLKNTDPNLVHMELDLGWVIMGGKDPLDYFKNYPGRFPLWHLKDMDKMRKESTEFGKGALDIPTMLAHREISGVKHIFIEQEEYESTPEESMRHNMDYLAKL